METIKSMVIIKRLSDMNWQDYEIFIHKNFRQLYPNAKISYNVKN
jgi:hypothetical protein